MGIKETPTNFRVYYTCMKEYYNKQKDEANHAIDALTSEIARQKTDILAKEQAYKKEYDIVLSNYQEFVDNEYIDGTFFKDAQNYFTKINMSSLFINLTPIDTNPAKTSFKYITSTFKNHLTLNFSIISSKNFSILPNSKTSKFIIKFYIST